MDETPQAPAIEGRRRRLLFRANHRGTRENDILVGGFVSARLADFTETEIAELQTIMDLPDPVLADWLTGRAPIAAEHNTPLMRAIREARGT